MIPYDCAHQRFSGWRCCEVAFERPHLIVEVLSIAVSDIS